MLCYWTTLPKQELLGAQYAGKYVDVLDTLKSLEGRNLWADVMAGLDWQGLLKSSCPALCSPSQHGHPDVQTQPCGQPRGEMASHKEEWK